jgi:hypothetical protein
LLYRYVCVFLGSFKVNVCRYPVVKRSCDQSRKVSNVPVRESDRNASGRNVGQSMNGIGREAVLCLLTIRDDRRTGGFESLNGILNSGVV